MSEGDGYVASDFYTQEHSPRVLYPSYEEAAQCAFRSDLGQHWA